MHVVLEKSLKEPQGGLRIEVQVSKDDNGIFYVFTEDPEIVGSATDLETAKKIFSDNFNNYLKQNNYAYRLAALN